MTPNEALSALGLQQADFERLCRLPFDRAVKQLQELQLRARKSFRRLALELHPDRTGGNEEKTRRFLTIKAVYEEVSQLKVQQIQPVVLPPAFHVQFRGGYRPFASTTTTSSATTMGSAVYVVTMRPRSV